jgi:uncharacterized membrane protein
VAPLVILLLAAGLRLWGLGEKSLWMDEIFTVQKASMPLDGMMHEIVDHDAHPPLFQLVEWVWLRFGRGDAFARLPSAIFGVVAVWLIMAVGRRLFSRNAGLAAGFLAALSWFQVYHSQDARLYAMVTALVLAQFLLLLKILSRRGRAGWGLWSAYGLFSIASLYTYALCILSIGAMALLYLWRARPGRRQWLHLLTVHVIVGLLFLPWLPIMQKQSSRIAESLRALGDAAGRPSFAQLATGVATWAVGPQPWQYLNAIWTILGVRFFIAIGVILGVGFLVVAVMALALRRSRRPLKLIGALFLIVMVGYLVMPMPRAHEYEAKHLAFLQPLLLLAFAAAWRPRRATTAGRGRLGLMPVALLMMLPLNLYGLATYFQPDFQKENWRGLAADVAAKAGPSDLILFNPGYVGFAFDQYARTDLPRAGIEGLFPEGAAVPPTYRRLWLVSCFSPVARPTADAAALLGSLGWHPVAERSYAGAHGDLSWVMFERGGAP